MTKDLIVLVLITMVLCGIFLHYLIEVHPKLSWKCIFGLHDYTYIGKKSGMAFNIETGQVEGSTRRVHECKCGKERPIDQADYIENI